MLEGSLLYNIIATPNHTPWEGQRITPFTRPEEFHCQVFTGLLEKLFLAVFCRQEMTVGETAMELGSLMLMEKVGASLVAQWLRICLLMQGTRVRALVWEDPTCHGAAGPVSHNY